MKREIEMLENESNRASLLLSEYVDDDSAILDFKATRIESETQNSLSTYLVFPQLE